jgi:hypothetical protein
VDTRLSSPFPPPGCIPGGGILQLTTPSTTIAAVVFNVTVTEPTASGYITVFPAPPPPPLASNLNYVPGQTVPNLVIVGVGSGGATDFYNFAGCSHLVIDVFAVFTNATAPAPTATGADSTPPDLGSLFTLTS